MRWNKKEMSFIFILTKSKNPNLKTITQNNNSEKGNLLKQQKKKHNQAQNIDE